MLNELTQQGLDLLLGSLHEARVVGVTDTEAWLCVTVETRASFGSRNISEWAVWRNTGNVYKVGLYGAVEENPTYIVTPLEDWS